tara:strand:+ start:787 stop:966 length:180 start_codon:yes stop_codon:yes gene_type:complete
MKREKRVYENGYWPKVEYWTGLLNQALREKDVDGALLCVSKLEYFSGRQKDLEVDLENV